jgi:hypothetical protein
MHCEFYNAGILFAAVVSKCIYVIGFHFRISEQWESRFYVLTLQSRINTYKAALQEADLEKA